MAQREKNTHHRNRRKTRRRNGNIILQANHWFDSSEGQRFIVILSVVVFIIMLLILVQHSYISKLDTDIRDLETQLQEIQSENDSKEGQITAGQNLSQIEEKARSYGMQDPTADQYVYVTAESQNDNTSEQSVPDKIKSFFTNLFSGNS